jgi:hypothetical protein
MKTRPVLTSIVAVLFATAAVFPLGAQSRAASKPTNSRATLTAVQTLPLTCAQAWAAAHKSYPEARAIVTTLAKVSLANRDLTLPNTREAGFDAGKESPTTARPTQMPCSLRSWTSTCGASLERQAADRWDFGEIDPVVSRSKKRNRGERPIPRGSVLSVSAATSTAREIAIMIAVPSMVVNDHAA